MCALPDFYISDETKHCATPVSASPSMRVVEALVTISGKALMHVARHLSPNLGLAHISGAKARQWLYVNSDPLLDPVVLFRN